jgi:hypothetical protein
VDCACAEQAIAQALTEREVRIRMVMTVVFF